MQAQQTFMNARDRQRPAATVITKATDAGLAEASESLPTRVEKDYVTLDGGVLPKDDLARLYSSARFVLGVTMDAQREHGMINNRVFEALSCGATFVTEHFDALEQMFGGTMLYARRRGDRKTDRP